MRLPEIEAARGQRPATLLLRRARYLDVFSCSWREGDIAVFGQQIVAVEPDLAASGVADAQVDLQGRTVVPGFIDAHVHVESSCLTPRAFAAAVLPRGTTTAICDPHELTNVLGKPGLEYFLQASETLPLDLRVMLSSCVPATSFETNGGGHLSADDLYPLLQHPKALGLAEVMNVPGVLEQDPQVLQKILAFAGVPIDGHCPQLSGRDLGAYAVAGISSCHESTTLAEAAEKLHKGIAVWIREGSVAKDLRTLVPLLSLATSTSLGFCTDDRNPLDIQEQGHLDYLIRLAIGEGVPTEVAYRAASWSVARHYGLDRGRTIRRGAIAPGYLADLVVLADRDSAVVERVLRAGVWADTLDLDAAGGGASSSLETANTLRFVVPEAAAFCGPEGKVHVIGVDEGKILTRHEVMRSDSPDVARLTVLERYGGASPPANAYVQGFGRDFSGAIASSVGHDSHNVIVVGRDTASMLTAVSALKSLGGGFVVAKADRVLAQLALPFGGLMTSQAAPQVAASLKQLRLASRSLGCELSEPFLQLAFLSLPVIPALKLTDKGLFDVARWSIIGVKAD